MAERRRWFADPLPAILMFAAIALACAGRPVSVTEIPLSANPDEQIEQLGASVEQGQSQLLPVLSPTWFSRAQASLEQARAVRREGGAVEAILEHVAEGQAELGKARGFAEVARVVLPEAIEARGAARKAGATRLGADYETTEEGFLSLTRSVEEDDLSRVEREGGAIAARYRALELRAIKERTLAAVRERIDQASREGAVQVAPDSLAVARGKLREAEAFIADHRYATDEMNERARSALFYADRAIALTRFANETQRQRPEERALAEEQFLTALAGVVELGDLRDRSIADQRLALYGAIKELRNDRDFLVTQSDRLRSEVAALRGTTELLEREREFNRLFVEVRSYFDPEEAEVYKQGSRLLIRLRGVQFPVGGHVIQPDDYALLTKVQMSIRTFGTPNVVIEGHTDSTGGPALNQHLSEQRAEAVRSYLVANNVLPADQITAVGKGFSDPLAPNATVEGRALNRRIDVIIEPRAPSAAEIAAPMRG